MQVVELLVSFCLHSHALKRAIKMLIDCQQVFLTAYCNCYKTGYTMAFLVYNNHVHQAHDCLHLYCHYKMQVFQNKSW